MSKKRLAGMIDHAVLRPDATADDVRSACRMAGRLGVACLIVRPCDVWAARQLLGAGDVAVGSVVSFPHGAADSGVKAAEAAAAVRHGADELDMVINIGRLKDGRLDRVRDDIAAVVEAAEGRTVKVILECCYLSRDEMAAGCHAAQAAGADFVKTSTGFGTSGARAEDVRFLRSQVGRTLGVKAAGGIRTLADALAMIEAGADRIGTSSTEAILGRA